MFFDTVSHFTRVTYAHCQSQLTNTVKEAYKRLVANSSWICPVSKNSSQVTKMTMRGELKRGSFLQNGSYAHERPINWRSTGSYRNSTVDIISVTSVYCHDEVGNPRCGCRTIDVKFPGVFGTLCWWPENINVQVHGNVPPSTFYKEWLVLSHMFESYSRSGEGVMGK